MAGNSARRGATRKSGSKKGMVVGSGGQRRKALEGKGPTPRAEERPSHPKARRTKTAARRGQPAGRSSRAGPSARGRQNATETVAGRNAVVEALRAGVPVKALYVAERIDLDDRVREVLRIAADRRLPLLEAPRPELDRITMGAVHQGVALTVPPYLYAHPDDLVAVAREGRRGATRRGTRRSDRPAQPRSGDQVGRGFRSTRSRRSRTSQRRPDGRRLEGFRRCGCPRSGRSGDEPRSAAAFLPRRRTVRRGSGRRR